uniref:SHSP domain-containing protein n=1 Tax=Scylla olivacea TaxID=85551 RepID=A0A0P4VPE5_SCYOL
MSTLLLQFVLDVQDFSSRGEVAVMFVSEREVVVEGRVDEQGQCSSACRRFQRRFLVPCPVDVQAVTSVLSADGVLTITAPKKVRQQHHVTGAQSSSGAFKIFIYCIYATK